MMGSQPHFYGADPSLVEKFASGISPDKDKHAIYMHFEMVIEIFKNQNKKTRPVFFH